MRGAIRGLTCLWALLAAMTPLGAFAIGLPPGVSDMLEITDDSGTPVMGSDGKPAVVTISESAENASGGVSVTLTVGSFQSVGSQATSFGLVDPGILILPGARGGCFTSDDMVVLRGGGGLQVSMSSAACSGGSLP